MGVADICQVCGEDAQGEERDGRRRRGEWTCLEVPDRKSLQDVKTSDPEAKLGVCEEEEGEESPAAATDTAATENATCQTEF